MNPQDNPNVDEIIRRQLTPTLLPILEKLQQIENHAKKAQVAQDYCNQRLKDAIGNATEFGEQVGATSEKLGQLQAQIAQVAEYSERMLRMPPEPTWFWWGVLLGNVMGAGLMCGLFIYLGN